MRLRAALPCAQSRSTVHPEHNTLYYVRMQGPMASDGCNPLVNSAEMLNRDIHVTQGPEVRYPTPSATCEIMGQWFLKGELH